MSPLDQLSVSAGYKSYNDYLNSPHWKEFRRRYSISNQPQRCRLCPSTKIELHHIIYTHLGKERLDDVTPLCRTHHQEVHRWLEEHKLPIIETEYAIQRLLPSLHLLYCKPCNLFQMRTMRSTCSSCPNKQLIQCWSRTRTWNLEAPHRHYIEQLQPKEF